ncbi:MAG: metallophosphoesterase, partial [Nanoarchaeota archaeon]
PEIYKIAEDVLLDDVIALKCSGTREMVFVNNILFPEAMLFERKKSPEDVYAAFTGDTHFGSAKFQERAFLKFVDFLNGKIKTTTDVDKIKYLFIVGDLVDGVGIYPGQERELAIKDIEEQYQKAAEILSKIRKDIKIIICPGNHDAVRIMEPQPILNEKYAWPLFELDNVILTTNPALVNIAATKDFSGMNVLLYHGYSYNYYANNVSSLRLNKAYTRPEIIREFLLKRRHLAPTHSSTLYFPHEKDVHLIRDVPDILLSGDLHKSSVAYYNNILSISSSCWQEKTDFQEKVGHEPDIAKVPLLNLKTRAIKILDFEEKDEH